MIAVPQEQQQIIHERWRRLGAHSKRRPQTKPNYSLQRLGGLVFLDHAGTLLSRREAGRVGRLRDLGDGGEGRGKEIQDVEPKGRGGGGREPKHRKRREREQTNEYEAEGEGRGEGKGNKNRAQGARYTSVRTLIFLFWYRPPLVGLAGSGKGSNWQAGKVRQLKGKTMEERGDFQTKL
ncbi:hypothetical protein P170DRAFT_233154 [Aspergillus steynii IBT 23096]|uniref:Uncharacterized protein n=1 Tax=Aspergillus steynii IBT 23096 TaxID=1392250 RepID=A0A2I2G2E9_9EURO|nr:uncharacterized protein P170DRAFT_233154 [Aspergillus steynii IBT 23096]PLB47058.1 hypothetical protein P170DRAFT_233154 [Aspergillus steynii IBT 23096]